MGKLPNFWTALRPASPVPLLTGLGYLAEWEDCVWNFENTNRIANYLSFKKKIKWDTKEKKNPCSPKQSFFVLGHRPNRLHAASKGLNTHLSSQMHHPASLWLNFQLKFSHIFNSLLRWQKQTATSAFNCWTQHGHCVSLWVQHTENESILRGETAHKSPEAHAQITDGRGQPLN